jgi:hypothetical protein
MVALTRRGLVNAVVRGDVGARASRMNSLRLVFVAVLALSCTLPSGCASFHEDMRDVWRGVPISVDDIPEGVISTEHRNTLRQKGATIERCGDGDSTRYRIELPTGELWWIDASGKVSDRVV